MPATPPTHPGRRHLLILLGLWLAIFFASLFSPPLLDDADATHAQAARAIVTTNDWVTLHVNGIRYLEKPPLPYWLVALSFRLFGFNTFAVHLPSALAVLALAALGYHWSRRAFDERTAFYTALATLTSTGTFLFTRIFIPEALFSLFLAYALYTFLHSLQPATNLSSRPEPERSAGEVERPTTRTTTNPGAPFVTASSSRVGSHEAHTTTQPPEPWALNPGPSHHPYLMWTARARAVLTQGLVALIFFFATATLYLALTRQLNQWRRLKPFTGLALFLAIAAPWHILASLRNTAGENGHGFAWFYFINEHVLRFLGRRIPRDYNKLPTTLYWSLHLIWLFPWSLFAPAALIQAWRHRSTWQQHMGGPSLLSRQPRETEGAGGFSPLNKPTTEAGFSPGPSSTPTTKAEASIPFTTHTILILTLFSALVAVFFSLSTNQEYYTFPIYLPLLILITAAIAQAEQTSPLNPGPWALNPLLLAHIAFTTLGLAIAAALASGLYAARHEPFIPDIGTLLAHRGVGDYTLSMSHFFDLTGPSFAALRLPAVLALAAFTLGPAIALTLRLKRHHEAATLTIALTSAAFLIAAHLALARFAPMLSSKNFADKITQLRAEHRIEPATKILLFGDQSFGSSIPFYLEDPAFLVDGRSSSMLFGSTFPDALPIFVTSQQLVHQWGHGTPNILFVPAEKRAEVDRLLGPHQIILEETSGKALIIDRPLMP